MFNIIEDFYLPNEIGLITLNFINLHFKPTYQPRVQNYGGDRFNAYPCYETEVFEKNDEEFSNYNIFKKKFEFHTNVKIKELQTFLRKIKKDELKKSAAYKNNRPHKDDKNWDISGILYFNSGSIKDGTYIYNNESDFDPSIIIGSKLNRCVFYKSSIWHSPGMHQEIDERWVQPFFIKIEKNKEENET
tara:strand:+ start:1077 stop:1643 length:567 start_codon:yes stop_codon:yes gene_type:complete